MTGGGGARAIDVYGQMVTDGRDEALDAFAAARASSTVVTQSVEAPAIEH
ncbi:hypothetical protein [Intrasporangium mesophilum]